MTKLKVKMRTMEDLKQDPKVLIRKIDIISTIECNSIVSDMFVFLGTEISIIKNEDDSFRMVNKWEWNIEPWMVEEKYREAMK